MFAKKILFFLFFISLFAFSQQPISVHLTEKDGLPDNEFYSALEDKDGFIWLGASKGLHRYDGTNYKLFSHPQQVGLSAFSVTLDDDNIVWYTNLANQLFYIKDGKVEYFGVYKDLFSGVLFDITILENKLILSTSINILVIDKNTKEVFYQNNRTKDIIYTTPFLRNETISFIGSFGDLIKLTNDYELKISNKKPTKPLGKLVVKRGTVFPIKNEKYFLRRTTLTEFIIFKITESANSISYDEIAVKENLVLNNFKIIDNQLFFLTSKGVETYEVKNGQLVLIKSYLKTRSVTDVVKDKEDNLWFTTLNSGVYIIPNLGLVNQFNFKGEDAIEKVFEGKPNEIFIKGNNDSIYKFNTLNNSIKSYSAKNLKRFEYLFYNKKRDKYFVHNVRLNTISFNNNNILLQDKFFSPVIKDHYNKNDDEIFIATSRSIYLINLNDKNDKFQKFIFEEKIRGYTCFYDEKKGKTYFGTVKGFFVYDENYNKSEIRFNDNSIYIQQILKTKEGTIWALSFKKGLFKIENDVIVKRYTVDNGLLTNVNSKITKQNSYIWIAGDKGLQRFNPKEESFENLTKINGIPSFNFTYLTYRNNQLFVATKQELFSLNPDEIFTPQENIIPKPYFTEIYVDDVLIKNDLDKLNLKEGINLKINFNVNGFLSNENTSYSYRLIEKGKVKSNWESDFTKVNEVIYNKISQGNYEFQLKAKKGNLTSAVISIPVVVEGFFYNQWWFYLFITIGIGITLFIYFKKQNTRLQERQSLELEKQNKELENIFLKLENLRSQMNPHFVFNALNSIQDYILNNQKNLAGDYLGKFADLIRKYLDQSTQKEILLQEEIDTLDSYLELEKLRFEDKLNYTISVADNIDTDDIYIPTILIQPYVENSLKHGLLHKKDSGNVWVNFTLNEEKKELNVIVRDDGVGREKAAEIQKQREKSYKSFATKATKARLDLLNYNRKAKISITTTDAFTNSEFVGTQVAIKIPLL